MSSWKFASASKCFGESNAATQQAESHATFAETIEALRRSERNLENEREHAASLRREAEKALQKQGDAQKALDKNRTSLSKLRKALAKKKIALLSERQRCVQLAQEMEASHGMLNQLKAAWARTEADLAKARTEIRLPRKANEKPEAVLRGLKDDLNTERRVTSGLRQEMKLVRSSKVNADADVITVHHEWRNTKGKVPASERKQLSPLKRIWDITRIQYMDAEARAFATDDHVVSEFHRKKYKLALMKVKAWCVNKRLSTIPWHCDPGTA